MSGTGGNGEDETTADDFGLLPLDESLDADELGDDVDETGYSPLDRRSGNLSWGFSGDEGGRSEPLSARLARELPDEPAEDLGDGLGDASDTDGELIDDQVGFLRAGRLVFAEPGSLDPASEYWATDIGIDGGAASAEEAAIHIVQDDDALR